MSDLETVLAEVRSKAKARTRYESQFPYYDEIMLAEIERLRGIIDRGCNAIADAVNVSGGDKKRINAVQRRMRKEMG